MTDLVERLEIYYFDHGNASYFRTTDCPPHIATEELAQQTIDCATKFWAELYGSLHIVVAFVVAFFLQTFRFILYSIIRPVLVGVVQMTADYLIKPMLTVMFNGLLQPPLVLAFNVFTSVCDMMEPLARMCGHFLKPVADTLRAIRFVEIYNRRTDNVNQVEV